MSRFFGSLIAFLSLSFTALASIHLLAQNFQLAHGSVRNTKLIWTTESKAEVFRVYRKSSNSDFRIIATGRFKSYDDYDVPEGPHTYQIRSVGGASEYSNKILKNPRPAESLQGFNTYDNIKSGNFRLRSKIYLNDIYYEYRVVFGNERMAGIKEFTSVDGYDFQESRLVLTSNQICSGSTEGFCKLEAVSFAQHPTTFEVVMWAHWEEEGYGKGRAAVAYGPPGHGQWTFGGSFRPLGHDSRDITFFADDDGSGYVISSTRTNQDMNIYRLTPDWHHITGIVATVLKGQSREAPAMIRDKGIYYLFTSLAAGWYPSTPKYISATNIAGPWSESRVLGNLGGFSTQSGEVVKIGSNFVMRANKWRIPDIDPAGTPLRQVILILSTLDGMATAAFYPEVLYGDTGAKAGIYGVQSGRIVSVGKSVASTGAATGHPEYLATSGVNLIPQSFFQPTGVPFIYVVDLGATYKMRHIELTTFLLSGSEAAAQFTVEGSHQATGPFQPFLDKSDNTRVGFVSAPVLTDFTCRYVALRVQKFNNMHNKQPSTPRIYEFTAFGAVPIASPAIDYATSINVGSS